MIATNKQVKRFGKAVLLLGGLLVAGSGIAAELSVAASNQVSSITPAKTIDELIKAANTGDADAMLGLGAIHYKGIGVVQNNSEAIRWFLQAADLGHSDAMFNLGIIYLQSGGGFQGDIEAVGWYRKAADLGNADAMSNLGLMYEEGRGVAQSYNEAIRWYRKAIELDNAYGMLNLANMYVHGRGIAQNDREAVALYRKAANLGDAGAMQNLGMMYQHGRAVNQSYSEAMNWYIKSAELGEPGAMFNIAIAYANGLGVVTDDKKAVHWLRKAADSGSINAMNSANNISLTTALSRQLASYGNWNNIDALAGTSSIWRIYDGQSGPLLRSLLAPLSVTGSGSRTYDGTTTFSGAGYTLSSFQADFSKILGIESYSGTAIGARNAGTYSLAVSGLYSNQQGYDLSFASGDFVVNKRQLTLTATAADKVYDGKLTAAGKPTITGRVRGDSIVGLTQSYADKNAGTGKTVQVNGGYTIRDGSGGNNYEVLLVDSYDGVITPKNITLSTVANSKVYDGGVTSANKPVVTGLITGDRVTGLFQQYETKTVGDNKKLLIKNGYVQQDGNNGSNYVVTEQGSNDGVITAH